MTTVKDAKTGEAPHISAFTKGDLGLKIGVRYGDNKEQMGFVPILGWASVGNHIEAGTRSMTPVVKDATNHPVLATPATVKGMVGLFPTEAIVDDLAAMKPDDRPVE
ncbi:MAG: hypothetical protein QNJ44_08955 [Rhodobacter sp.]|nr:hypothetical protein [Rhodobacter sp.]